MNKYYKGMIKAVKNGDKSAEEELLTTLNYIEDLQSQLEQKEDNWNKLKEWLKEEIEHNTPNLRWKHYNEDGFHDYTVENGEHITMQPINITLKDVLEKLQEIEGGMNE